MDASTLKAGSTKVNMAMSSKVALKSGPTMMRSVKMNS